MLFFKYDRTLFKVARTIDLLARLRPRLVLPALLARLEEGLVRVESPLRYTRPLYALCFCVPSLSFVRFGLFQRGYRVGGTRSSDGSDPEPEDSESGPESDSESDAQSDLADQEHVGDEMTDLLDSGLNSLLIEDTVGVSKGRKVSRFLHGLKRSLCAIDIVFGRLQIWCNKTNLGLTVFFWFLSAKYHAAVKVDLSGSFSFDGSNWIIILFGLKNVCSLYSIVVARSFQYMHLWGWKPRLKCNAGYVPLNE